MAKMWAGRFSKEVDPKVNDFNSSISFDSRMYKQDIEGSIAHATMLKEQCIIESDEADKIIEGLKGILSDIENGKLLFDPNAEDIHMFVESVLTERLGSTGKRLHTARSRNDQVALDNKMFLKDEVIVIKGYVKELIETLIDIAKKDLETVMPGYTHMQRAQPVTFAHHLMAYVEMFLRDMDRLNDAYTRMNICPLGSGALATTTYPIDRYLTADLLGFSAPTMNSIDGVSDRDYMIELGSDMSILMMHMSRFSEEIILWCSTEFKFIELDDAFATGSSIMPQKKNPDVTELIRGKTGRVYGDLITLLTMMKGLPLAYNKDMQEDKEAIFDVLDTVKLCITTFIPMLKTMTVKKENMRKAVLTGFINATDVADYLVKKGMPFRDAYKISGTLVAKSISLSVTLDTLPLSEYKTLSDSFEEDIYEAIKPETSVKLRKAVGGPAPETVEKHIKMVEEKLKEKDEEI